MPKVKCRTSFLKEYSIFPIHSWSIRSKGKIILIGNTPEETAEVINSGVICPTGHLEIVGGQNNRRTKLKIKQ